MTSKKVLLGVTIDDSLQFLIGYPNLLRERGWDVHVASSPGPRLDHLKKSHGVSVHPIEMRRQPSPWKDLLALFSWVRVIQSIGPLAVVAGTPKAGLLGMIAALLMRVPVRTYLLYGLRLETTSGLRRSALNVLEKLAMRCATEVIAISPSLMQRALDLDLVSSRKIQVLGHGSANGIELSDFDLDKYPPASLAALHSELGLRPGIPVVGYVGRLTRDKGLFDLAEAATHLFDRGLRFQLLVVGGVDDDSGESILETMYRLDAPVTVTGHVASPAPYFALMDVFCMPSYREGFGNAVIEASAMGIPVVVSDATGIVDAIEEGGTGLSTPVGDPRALASALEQILQSPSLGLQMGSRGRQWVRDRFSRALVQQLNANHLEKAASQRSRQHRQNKSLEQRP